MSFVAEAIWRRCRALCDSSTSPVEVSITIAAFAPCSRGAPDGVWAAALDVARSSANTAPTSAKRAVTARA